MPALKHGFNLVFIREIRYILRHRATLFITLIGPLLSFVLITYIFMQGVPRDLPVAVVDQDHTELSRTVNRLLDATPIAATDRDFTSLKSAQLALEKGDVNAIVVISEGFEKNIRKASQSDVALYINNLNVVKAGLLNSGLRKALLTISTGVKLKSHIANGKTYQQAYESSLPVAVNSKVLFNPFLNYAYFLAAALMPMLIIAFTLLASVYSIGRELRHGSGRSLIRLSGGSIVTALFAKLLPYTMVYTFMAMVMNLILFHNLGMPMHGNFGLIFLSEILLIVSYQFLAIFFLSLFKNMRLVLSVASAYSMMALTFSGLTFPLYGMPSGAQVFAQIFPFTHWLRVFIGQAMRDEAIQHSFSSMQIFVVFILVGMLCVPRLSYILQTPKFWGKQ